MIVNDPENPTDGAALRKHLDKLMVFCSSYERIPELLSLYYEVPDRTAWFATLGGWWSMCDNISEYFYEISDLLEIASPSEWAAMMTDAEQRELALLPPTLTVYRGCYEHNVHGLSWSLDESVARRFPGLHRYRQPGQPLLATARVDKAVCALNLDRSEQEVIALDPKFISVRPIDFGEG